MQIRAQQTINTPRILSRAVGRMRVLWCKFVAICKGARSTNFISCSRKTLSCKFISTLSRSLLYPRQLSICVEMNGHQSRGEREKSYFIFVTVRKLSRGCREFRAGKESENERGKKSEPAAAFLSRARHNNSDWLTE
jgi:hypothetical protein